MVPTADGTPCSVTHQGSLCTSKFSIPHISFVPELSMSLLSVGQITDMDNFVGFNKTSCYVQDLQSKRIIGTGHRLSGSTPLYELDTLHLLQLSHHLLPLPQRQDPPLRSLSPIGIIV
jgi:hypothetical protein